LEHGWEGEPSPIRIITVQAGQGDEGARRAGIRKKKFKGSGSKCEYKEARYREGGIGRSCEMIAGIRHERREDGQI
jgi:hypothetical protein